MSWEIIVIFKKKVVKKGSRTFRTTFKYSKNVYYYFIIKYFLGLDFDDKKRLILGRVHII